MFGEHTSCCDGGWLRHSGDHAPHRHQQDGCLAVAGAVHERRRQRSAARQDPSVAHPALAGAVEQSVVARTLADPPGETTHWTAAMAQESGISVSSVQRIWRRHGLRPHRVRQFKLSNDRQFASKLRDIVGLYSLPLRRRGSIRRPTPSCCRSMKRARSRHWTALSQACP